MYMYMYSGDHGLDWSYISEYMSDNIGAHFVSSMISGLITTIFSMPVDIIKTRYMLVKLLKTRYISVNIKIGTCQSYVLGSRKDQN